MELNNFRGLHIGQEIYWESILVKVTELRSDVNGDYCIRFENNTEKYFSKIMDELSFDKPKMKVKRAQYVCKLKICPAPYANGWFYRDQKELLDSSEHSKQEFDFIIRLDGTEREFEE